MNSTINWLWVHKRTTVVIAVVYFVLNVLLHEPIQSLALRLIELLSARRVDLAAAGLGLAVTLAILPWTVRQLRAAPHKSLKGAYCVATLAFVLLSQAYLVAINSEAIHFPQYAGLAILVFPLVGRFGETVLIVTMLGAVDEGVQYWVWHRNWDVYLDFNDFVLNLLGAAAGVLLVALTTDSEPRRPRQSCYSPWRFVRSPAFLALALCALAALILWAFGRLTLYPADDPVPWLVLRRCGPPRSFWSDPEWGRAYHVLTPVEGALITLGLVAFYVAYDFRVEALPRWPRGTTAR